MLVDENLHNYIDKVGPARRFWVRSGFCDTRGRCLPLCNRVLLSSSSLSLLYR